MVVDLETQRWSPSQHIAHLFEALKNRPVQKLLVDMEKDCICEGVSLCIKEDDVEKHVDAFKQFIELSQQHTPRLQSISYHTFCHTSDNVIRIIRAVRTLLY